MRQIGFSIAAGSLLAAFAWAQSRPGPTVPRLAAHVDDSGRGFSTDPLVYVLTNDPQTLAAGFGIAHLGSGAFVRIGPTLPSDLGHALAPTREGSLLSMAFSGRLYSINPRTGETSIVGATGLGDCSSPASPCGPDSANTLGQLDGKYYALDFNQNLYSLDPATGATKLIGATSIPRVTFVPGSIDPSNGRLDLYDESLFSFHGRLYANFDSVQFDLTTGSETGVVPAALYEIDPETGNTTTIAATDLGLLTIVNVNDAIYAYDSINNRFMVLDIETGRTRVVDHLDPSAGLVCGATPARPRPPDRR